MRLRLDQDNHSAIIANQSEMLWLPHFYKKKYFDSNIENVLVVIPQLKGHQFALKNKHKRTTAGWLSLFWDSPSRRIDRL